MHHDAVLPVVVVLEQKQDDGGHIRGKQRPEGGTDDKAVVTLES
jgi:hypothetical protein